MMKDIERLKSAVQDLEGSIEKQGKRRASQLELPQGKDLTEIRDRGLLNDIKVTDHEAKINMLLRASKHRKEKGSPTLLGEESRDDQENVDGGTSGIDL
jgi:hypothetical protein